jgi:hypothetical protein
VPRWPRWQDLISSHLLNLRTTSILPRGTITGGACVIQIQFRRSHAMPDAVRTSPADHAMAPPQNNSLPAPLPGSIFRKLPEGGVIFSTDTEVYFGVTAVGARIWELLPPATGTLDEMVAILASEYNDVDVSKIRTDVERFIAELLTNELVAHHPAPPQRDRPVP